VLAAPESVSAHWLGEENASHPAVRYLARSLGVRDLALGVLAWRTLDDVRVGPQVVAACAVADAVDALATVAVSSKLPRIGAIGTVVAAGGAAAVGFRLARELADA
jgi:hypothetical protein